MSHESDDELTMEELADGIALWQEHQPQTREDWLRIVQRWHRLEQEAPDNPSPMFGALYDAWTEVERLRIGLLACARESGADVSDGIPDFPDIVAWAVDCVKALRTDYEADE